MAYRGPRIGPPGTDGCRSQENTRRVGTIAMRHFSSRRLRGGWACLLAGLVGCLGCSRNAPKSVPAAEASDRTAEEERGAAATALDNAAASSPNDAAAFYRRALQFKQKGLAELANLDLTAAIKSWPPAPGGARPETDPKYVDALCRRAWTWISMGDCDKARDDASSPSGSIRGAPRRMKRWAGHIPPPPLRSLPKPWPLIKSALACARTPPPKSSAALRNSLQLGGGPRESGKARRSPGTAPDGKRLRSPRLRRA